MKILTDAEMTKLGWQELLVRDIAQHIVEAGPEPPTPFDVESHRRWSEWWLVWFRKPLRYADQIRSEMRHG